MMAKKKKPQRPQSTEPAVNRLIVVGSPRERGRSMHLAELLFEACIEDCPSDEVAIAPVATLSIAPCTGCDACANAGAASVDDIAGAGAGEENDSALATPCAHVDDMAEVRDLIDAADELIVVSPVYFSGPPAQFKALLDRMQPYYYALEAAREEGRAPVRKRPMVLHVIGEGGDPHGYAPLVGIVRSAFGCAGFSLEAVYDWVGKIDAGGEIVADADVYAVRADGSLVAADDADAGSPSAEGADRG